MRAPLELRQVLRSLRRTPLFTATVVITLALGIGATTAVFSVVNAVLLRPLPYANADRLVALRHALPGIGIPDVAQSLGTYFHYRHTSRTLASIAGYQPTSINLASGSGGGAAEPERVRGAQISANMLPTLGVAPERGRGFLAGEERPQSAHVALIGDGLWRRRFGADPAILDREIRVNGAAYRVVGVLPPSFHFPDPESELWLPLQLDSATPHAGGFSVGAVGRLAAGATPASAQAELNRLLARLPESYPDVYQTIAMPAFLAQSRARAVVRTLRADVLGDFGRALWIVGATVALVLVVTCANVMNLLLVRAQGRGHELAVRTALGASRARVAGRFLLEGLVLAGMGCAAGLALAWAAVDLLVRAGPSSFPRWREIGIDLTTVGFTVLVALVVAVVCSALPALRFRTMQVGMMLREGGRSGTATRERHRAQRTLIVVQVALALVLLAGSGVLARTVWRIQRVPPGFDPAHTLAFTISLPQGQYASFSVVNRFWDQAVDRLRDLPGVEAAGVTSKLPLVGGESLAPVSVERFPTQAGALPPPYPFPVASAGYFRAMHIGLIAGRLFGGTHDPAAARETVVSRAFAEHYWHDPTGRSALGERLRVSPNVPWSTIVGVVESVRDTSLTAAPEGEVYFPLTVPDTVVPDSVAPPTARVMTIVLRAAGDPAALAPAARRAIRALDATIPVYDLQPMTEVLARATARTRFVLIALGIAAGITLVLGAVGLYGVIAYLVSLRTRELGLRIALGAEPRSVLALVLREGVALAAAGVVAGVVVFAAVGGFLRGLLFGISPADPATLATVALVLLLVAAVASWLPARRAARIDPLDALRAE